MGELLMRMDLYRDDIPIYRCLGCHREYHRHLGRSRKLIAPMRCAGCGHQLRQLDRDYEWINLGTRHVNDNQTSLTQRKLPEDNVVLPTISRTKRAQSNVDDEYAAFNEARSW